MSETFIYLLNIVVFFLLAQLMQMRPVRKSGRSLLAPDKKPYETYLYALGKLSYKDNPIFLSYVIVFFVLLSAFFYIDGLWFDLTEGEMELWPFIGNTVFFLFFIYEGRKELPRILKHIPQNITLDAEGVSIPSQHPFKIAWSDIRVMSLDAQSGVIVLELSQFDKYVADLGWFKRVIYKVNRFLSDGDFGIRAIHIRVDEKQEALTPADFYSVFYWAWKNAVSKTTAA